MQKYQEQAPIVHGPALQLLEHNARDLSRNKVPHYSYLSTIQGSIKNKAINKVIKSCMIFVSSLLRIGWMAGLGLTPFPDTFAFEE